MPNIAPDIAERVEELQAADHVRMKLRRPVIKRPKNPALEWVPLVEETPGADIKEPTHDELRAMDRRRKALLSLARSTSAIDTITKLRTLPRTVLPRLAAKPLASATGFQPATSPEPPLPLPPRCSYQLAEGRAFKSRLRQ